MKFETLLTERRNGRLYITLNRPDARNALSKQMIAELHTLLDDIKTDLTLRVVLFRGAGGWFCAGGDLKEFQAMADLPYEEVVANSNRIGTLLTKVNELPQVVIMMLEGAAIGGGFGLTCVSDIAIATFDTRFSLSETSIGLPPAQIAPFVVPRIGQSHARRLMLTSARFKGEEAERLGLVHFVVPDGDILTLKGEEMAQQVERCSPTANAVTKAILRQLQPTVDDEGFDQLARQFANMLISADGREGLASFVEKRKPKWNLDA